MDCDMIIKAQVTSLASKEWEKKDTACPVTRQPHFIEVIRAPSSCVINEFGHCFFSVLKVISNLPRER